MSAYCVRGYSESTTCQTCQQTKLPQKLLQDFVSKHQAARQASWGALELETLTLEDCALTLAAAFFWQPISEILNDKNLSCLDLAQKLSMLSPVANDLGHLLGPFQDDLLPKIEQGVRIWEKFAAAEPLWKAFSIVARYSKDSKRLLGFSEPGPHLAKISLNQIQLCIALFPAQHLHLAQHANLSSQLQMMDGWICEGTSVLVQKDSCHRSNSSYFTARHDERHLPACEQSFRDSEAASYQRSRGF